MEKHMEVMGYAEGQPRSRLQKSIDVSAVNDVGKQMSNDKVKEQF
jgi:hypothetical protein